MAREKQKRNEECPLEREGRGGWRRPAEGVSMKKQTRLDKTIVTPRRMGFWRRKNESQTEDKKQQARQDKTIVTLLASEDRESSGRQEEASKTRQDIGTPRRLGFWRWKTESQATSEGVGPSVVK